MDVRGRCTRWRHAARGEVYDSEAGPEAPGRGWSGGHTARANKDSGQVYPGYSPEVDSEVNTEKRVQGPTHGDTRAKHCQNVPSFLIEHGSDEVSQTGY